MDDKAMVTDITGNGREPEGAHNCRLSPSSPVAEQSNVNVTVERTRNHNGGSDRKRNRRAMADDGALDDIMGQITSKLTTLSTKESFTEEDSIGAFIDVLNCSRSEAQFYLESSAWNVETAVMLWLENNPVNSHSSSYLPSLAVPPHAYYTGAGGLGGMGPYFDSAMGASSSGMPGFNRPKGTPMYRPREVIIEGLPAGWSARVSKHSGQVYFVDQSSGKTQYCVPAGYADRHADGVVDLSHSASSHDEEGMADDLEGSMEQDAPDSPVAGPPNSIDPRNSRPVAHRSGIKSGSTYNNSPMEGGGGAFRTGMDNYNAYNAYSDASVGSDASSNKAVWDGDDGSGYSLNDGVYSVSSTTNSTTDNSPVFGSMRGGHTGGATASLTSTFLSGNNSMLTTASSTSDALNPNTALPQHDNNHNSNMQYFGHHSIYGNQGNHTANNHLQNNHNGAQEGPMTQDPTPTPLDTQLYHQAGTSTSNGQSHSGGSSRPSSGIAMLGPASEADHSSDYFLGAFTPASSQHSSSNDLL